MIQMLGNQWKRPFGTLVTVSLGIADFMQDLWVICLPVACRMLFRWGMRSDPSALLMPAAPAVMASPQPQKNV